MDLHARSGRSSSTPTRNTGGGYAKYCKPGLVDRLTALRLDITYERAEGDYLWYRDQGVLRRVLDLVGGYGVNLFGHYHPDLVAIARAQIDAQAPVFAQASCRSGAGRLAEALCDRLGDYIVTFVNSGTEAIEAALKHAFLERPRPVYWAVRGGFHGKTLGAVQFTWSQRDLFPGMGPRVRYLDPDDPADWVAAQAEIKDVAAAIFEPIAGEGGVRPRPAAFVQWLTRTCRDAGVPLIADEVQTGMGRTGTFLACEAMGIEPDYLCLGKALGGGLAKVGAMLVRRDRAVEAFSMLHSSTFAEDDPGCMIGLEALRIIARDGVPARCAALGRFLRRELEALHLRYPGQIQDVRGLGLMVGLELRPQPEATSHVIRAASQQGLLGYFAASYLLHAHSIRVMPTLSQPLTLRVQPSAYITEPELSRFVGAVEGLCQVLKAGDAGRLLDGAAPTKRATKWVVPPALHNEPAQTPRRVAFLTHLLSDQQLADLDPSLARFTAAEMTALLDRTARVWEPLVLDQAHVHSVTGADVHLSVIGLGVTARQIIRAMQARDVKWIMEKLEAAVALAVGRGCRAVGFGGFTSIVSHNCKRITTPGAALTTGNSLTVGMGLQAILQAANELGIDLRRARLAVVGATGNIASTYAEMVAPLVGEVVLVGRDRASPRLAAVAAQVLRSAPRARCILADDCSALIGCDLVVAASNTPEPIIFPHHLGTDPVVICDISLPPDVSDDVLRERPNVRVIRGGVVRLPRGPEFSIAGIGLPPGHSLACMAETLLMGLEEATENWSVGAVTPEGVRRAMAAADTHGFAVADLEVLSTGPVRRFFNELRGRPREPVPAGGMMLAATEAPAR